MAFTSSYQFDHLSINDEVNREEEDLDCSFPKVFSSHISTNGSKNGDQRAKEDEDKEDAEHEAVADGEVDLGLEGEGGEGDDNGCCGGSCHKNNLSFDEHQDQPQQQ